MKEIILKHPLIEHKLSILRNKKTSIKEFRELIDELTIFLCIEAFKDSETSDIIIQTPVTKSKCKNLEIDNYVFIPILRAGLGMSNGITKIIPNAKFGHIGLYRDEKTLEPKKYYFKIPKNSENKEYIILDPMLATGGSASSAITMLKKEGIKNIKFLCIISAPEGLKKLNEDHPDVQIYSTSLDEKLNSNGYIVPGLGDAGDRIFGTK